MTLNLNNVNSMPALGAPLTNIQTRSRPVGGPAHNRKDQGYGQMQKRLEAGGKDILFLDLLRSSVSDGAAKFTIHVTAATTVRVSTHPRSALDIERARVIDAPGVLSTNLWDEVTVAVGDIVTLPDNITGIYLEAAVVSNVTLRGA